MIDRGWMTPHFRVHEMACPCGKCGALANMQLEFMERLEDMRVNHYGYPMMINSAFRCDYYAPLIGVGVGDEHNTGWAADIRVTSDAQRYLLLEGARKAGFPRIGLGKTFMHVGCGPQYPSPRLWTYYP